MFCSFADSCSKGLFRSIFAAVAASSSMCWRLEEPDPGPSAPSSSGLDQSTMILAGSKSYLLPSPLHSGHAPYTLLKEKERGSNEGILMPQSGQAIRAENRCSSPFTTAT